MQWPDIRKLHPDQWLVIEALEAHTTDDGQRHLDRLAVIDTCANGQDALNRYEELHQEHPEREYYFVHTGRVDLDIQEKQWLGFRISHATHADEPAQRRATSSPLGDTGS